MKLFNETIDVLERSLDFSSVKNRIISDNILNKAKYVPFYSNFSASIILNTQIGYEFEGKQIDSLYHLVSQAIPNLPKRKHLLNESILRNIW